MASPALLASCPLLHLLLLLLLLYASVAAVRADVAADQKECTPQLIALSVCLPYAGGDAKAPTPDCCSALEGVVGKSTKCLCLLIKDRDDPSLKLKIDLKRALGLPGVCGVASNISSCPQLLNLPPNSPDAKVFTDFPSAQTANATSGTGASGGLGSSNGGRSNRYTGGGGGWWWRLGAEAATGRVWVYCFASLLVIIGN